MSNCGASAICTRRQWYPYDFNAPETHLFTQKEAVKDFKEHYKRRTWTKIRRYWQLFCNLQRRVGNVGRQHVTKKNGFV
jgi:hypothetical protein